MIFKSSLDSIELRSGVQNPESQLFDKHGSLNILNKNSSKSIVIQYIDYLTKDDDNNSLLSHVELEYEGYNVTAVLLISHLHNGDQNHLSIVADGFLLRKDKYPERFTDSYFIKQLEDNSLYMTCNGLPILEHDYIFLLNTIEATGFKFNLEL